MTLLLATPIMIPWIMMMMTTFITLFIIILLKSRLYEWI